jgi:hypothetical protein
MDGLKLRYLATALALNATLVVAVAAYRHSWAETTALPLIELAVADEGSVGSVGSVGSGGSGATAAEPVSPVGAYIPSLDVTVPPVAIPPEELAIEVSPQLSNMVLQGLKEYEAEEGFQLPTFEPAWVPPALAESAAEGNSRAEVPSGGKPVVQAGVQPGVQPGVESGLGSSSGAGVESGLEPSVGKVAVGAESAWLGRSALGREIDTMALRLTTLAGLVRAASILNDEARILHARGEQRGAAELHEQASQLRAMLARLAREVDSVEPSSGRPSVGQVDLDGAE